MGSEQPQSETWSGTRGGPTAPSRIASSARSSSTASSDIIVPGGASDRRPSRARSTRSRGKGVDGARASAMTSGPTPSPARSAMRYVMARDPSERGQMPRTRHASMPPATRGARRPRAGRPRHGPGRPRRRRTTSTCRSRASVRSSRSGERRQRRAVERAHDRARPERVREGRADIAAGHAEAEAGLLLPEHRLPVVANGMLSTFSPGRTTSASGRSWKSAGRSSPRDPELAVEARREREREQREQEPAHAPAAREEERREHGEREPDEHESAGRQRVARERQVVEERPRQRQPGAVPGHHEPRAERAQRSPRRPSARARARAAGAGAPTRRSPRARGAPGRVADLLGEVVAAELRGEVAQRGGRSAVDARRHEQVGEVRARSRAADAERIGVRERDPEVRRGRDERDDVPAQPSSRQRKSAPAPPARARRPAPNAKAPPSVAQKSVSRNVAKMPSTQSAKQDDEPAVGERAAQVARDDQAGQREREDERQVEVVERLGRLVGPEAEDEAAGERRPRARAQLPAQQERAPGRERGRREREDVVGRDRPEGRGQRPDEERRARDRARPGPGSSRPARRRGRSAAGGGRARARAATMPATTRSSPGRLRTSRRRAAAVAQHSAAEQRQREQRIARERGERAR